MTNAEKLTLAKHACHIRMGVIEGTHSAKCGHPGGSLDIAELLSYLYFVEMNIDPKDPKKADRDRLVLSKGHAAPALYAALAERGYFPVEDLKTLRKIGSYLQGHPNMNETPGVDMSTGSLGQGIHQFIISPIEQHSKKPDEAREKILALMGNLPRVELFARQKTPGWDAWGNEIASDIQLAERS